MKYLHERLLVMLISPPLPAVVKTQQVGTTSTIRRDGKDPDEADEQDSSTAESASSSELVGNNFLYRTRTSIVYACILDASGFLIYDTYIYTKYIFMFPAGGRYS